MTATVTATDDHPTVTPVGRLWHRQLDRFPGTGMRMVSLAIVVATTVVLYYQLYLAGAVGTQILRDLHMSFLFFVNISVFAYAAGAVASVLAGLADRYGRANIVTVGLLITGVLSVAVLPQMHTEYGFLITYVVIGFVEGIVLVATPALIRDFSPQLGRASAMGFWTLGPVLGSLVVAVIVTPTIAHHSWQWEYGVSGIVGLVVFAVAAVGLRELAPNLRDQLMVSQKDRVLIEARAKGLDIEASLKKPFRQMLHPDIVGSAVAISVFLIIYYIAVGFFPIFFETVFNYSPSKANGLGDYFWAFDAGGLLIVGIISDLVRVRKPFMVVGAVSSIVFTSIFAVDSAHNTPGSATSHATFVFLLSAIAVSLGIAFAPWMASFTETVERRNPALTATGLAVWGMIIRVTIAVVIVILPHVVTTVSTVVDKGGQIQAYEADATPVTTTAGATTVGSAITAAATHAALLARVGAAARQYAQPLSVLGKLDPETSAALSANPADALAGVKALSELTGLPQADVATVATLAASKPQALAAGAALDATTASALLANPADAAAGARAVGEVVAALKVTPAVAVADLKQLATIPAADLVTVKLDAAQITAAGESLTAASAAVPGDVKTLLGVTAPQQLGAADFAAISAVGTTAGNPRLTTALTYLSTHGNEVVAAQARSARQWRTYFWVGVGGQVLFIPLIFLMAGFWSPRRARQAELEHEAMIVAEMAKLPGA